MFSMLNQIGVAAGGAEAGLSLALPLLLLDPLLVVQGGLEVSLHVKNIPAVKVLTAGTDDCA